MQRNIILGFSSTELTAQEREFFQHWQPAGFIIFARNIKNPVQLKELIAELKSLINNNRVLILVDQEGGRVQRLKPPYFRGAKAAGEYIKLGKNAEQAVFHDHYLMGQELAELGINVNCAPVLDLLHEDAHSIIGDRSFGSSPEVVVRLAYAAMRGLMAAGVLPVIKHIPGHGRAKADSHNQLPVIDTPLLELEATDFVPFRELSFAPFAMTAHVVISAIDPENPVTLSSKAISYIRNNIGFKNTLITDALEMKALGDGSLAKTAEVAQNAGCDLLLHCSGKIHEMEEIIPYVSAINPRENHFWLR